MAQIATLPLDHPDLGTDDVETFVRLVRSGSGKSGRLLLKVIERNGRPFLASADDLEKITVTKVPDSRSVTRRKAIQGTVQPPEANSEPPEESSENAEEKPRRGRPRRRATMVEGI